MDGPARPHLDRRTLLLVAAAVEGGLAVLALALCAWSGLDPLGAARLSWKAAAAALPACLPLLGGLALALRSPWRPLAQLREEIDGIVRPVFAESRLPDMALIALLAGLGEELLFRGWLQGLLARELGLWPALLAASAVFGLAHFLSAGYALYAALTGLYLGIIYQATGNLYVVAAVHALYDFIALVILTRWPGVGRPGSARTV